MTKLKVTCFWENSQSIELPGWSYTWDILEKDVLNFLKSCEIGKTGTAAFGKNHMHCT